LLKKEQRYEFRKRMLTIHKPGLRDVALVPAEADYVIRDGFTICVPEGAADVAWTAARDFADYLLTSMDVSAKVKKGQTKGPNTLTYELNAAMEKGYSITVEEGVHIVSNDERSYAQALYALEDRMSCKRAPFLRKGTTNHKILFSPRMLHSGYELDKFPNEHLAAIAHAGRDAIMVFTKGVNLTPCGFVDFNELIYRASKYGIDVYAYSYLVSHKHPDEPDAQAYYEASYGELFKNCPGLKGVVLVGESVEFPSKDPNVSGTFYYNNTVDGVPTGKVSAGWWPCIDYPRWLEVVMGAIKKYKEDADIVFWSYNWGWAPKEERIRLIRSLPAGISLNVTYETDEMLPLEDNTVHVDDYTLAFAGPGKYFISEAEAAKERGIRLYSMTNTGGLSWDMGVIPYQPMPYQWMKRYEGMLEAHEKWGLCGLMESHHYGFWPSFIGNLSNHALVRETLADGTEISMEQKLRDSLEMYFGKEYIETVDRALALWSEAITHYVPSNSNQYGAFRIGPSYPFNLYQRLKPISADHAHFGNGIVIVNYHDYAGTRRSMSYVSLDAERRSLERMLDLLRQGVDLLKTIPQESANEELLYLINQGEYMCCMAVTGIHMMKWYDLIIRLHSEKDRVKIGQVLDEMEEVGRLEIANAESAIPFVELDSRLGWEPSMEYLGDADHIRWKIRQLKYVLEREVADYRTASKL